MKSYNHLYEQYISPDNYRLAVRNATKHKGGKRRKYRKARFYRDNCERLMPEMLDFADHFHNLRHRPKMIYDGLRRKQRMIIVPTMKEQVVHHMIVNVMKPIFMKSMYEHSYGSIPERGAHSAKKRIEKWIRKGGKNCKYCLKMDIRKYFDSIPHEILKEKFRKLIHDRDFLDLLYEIVDAVPGGRGIPIGFYTSQWIANWYLTDLDHYIKEQLGAVYYMRYMDDMVIFGPNKRKLRAMKVEIEKYLTEKLGLELKRNWQVFRFHFVKKDGTETGRDLDFMGFRFYRNRTVLRRKLMMRATRKARQFCKKKGNRTIYDARQMLSYLGWIDCTDTYGMYRKHIKPFVSFQYVKRYAGNYQRRLNAEDEALRAEQAERTVMKTVGKIRVKELTQSCGTEVRTATM